MSIPVLEETLEFLNNVDLNEPFEFITDGVAENFTNVVIRAAFVSADGLHRLDLSSSDGTIVKTGAGQFQFNVDKLVMWELPGGLYLFDIVTTTLQGADNPILRGKVKLIRGATPP